MEKQILDNKKPQKNKKPVKKAPASSSKPQTKAVSSPAKKKKAAQKTVKAPPPPKKLTIKALPPPKKLTAPPKAAPKKKIALKKPLGEKVVEKKVTEPEPKPQTVETPEVSDTASKSAVSGRVFGAKKGENRILVRAKKNSWIQIRDDVSKKLLLTRLLRRGDSYRVPNRKGLRLLTSNTEALEILIDGKAAPPLGGSGSARRSVALDVKKLLDGTAVTE
ncbi:MAG TPA: DUF4115 domain-containing protein [Rhodospirillales bacterium]|nr:DUF4115 domain-containing protein [Rhodospirillales bacterium]